MARIAFVGLGHMGLPMALNLVKAGHQVYGFDLQRAALEAFSKGGGIAARNIEEAIAEADLFISMLQTGEQVQKLCIGQAGVFSKLPKNCLHIDCSSIDVNSSKTIQEAALQYGIQSIDAPVSGGVSGAAAGSLTFMVGGSEENFSKAQVILAQMGKKIIHTGGPGSGQAAKICNNMILGISMIAISEAFNLAEHLGLSPKKLFEVVENSSGQCWAMSRYVPEPGILENVPANRDYQPGFTTAMMLKDLRLSQQSAESVNIQTVLGKKACELYQKFSDSGASELDFSAIIRLIKQSPTSDS